MTDMYLELNDRAAELHAAGVEHASARDIYAAQARYRNALDEVGDGDSPSEQLQQAMILRDRGFLPVRAAVAGIDDPLIGSFAADLSRSEAITTDLLEMKPAGEALRRLQSEHGATITVIGRSHLYLGLKLQGVSWLEDGAYEALEHFATAHEHLEQGSNGYFQASNAVHAARTARIAGEVRQIPHWIGQAMLGATACRRVDVIPSVQTIVNHGRDLRSRAAAIQGARTRP